MIDRLLGTWTLVSAVREEIPSGAKTDMFGQIRTASSTTARTAA